ncbi:MULTISPECIES: MBL fold metallo-hydrolase [unclassified Roseateles]|uniref:MBL fold metallo-hydrolase n=1 Tax=unclassified Roseateles TaxID=2626991 RepID=UPI0006FE7509|nr:MULTISPECIES: MBL fold metallo-hydrolase [unclassified Roseateles]KQW50801.1 MBL fold metallo-hydrolase [Pelomonas sp. Root405]KRA70840.1 MBL fold metallo-hydrolase [Pelomonas sp. Root662]
MRSFLRLILVASLALIASCASKSNCSAPYANSPQLQNCLFANPPNPDTPPGASGWSIWTRFLFSNKVGTVPVDAIPVRQLTTAQLAALDASANHVVRLGHSSHLLKLQGKFWLIDPVFGERVSPFSFAGPKRFHAPPLTLQQLPPIEGLILSHDHYDHLDVPTIEYLALRVQRYFVPLGVKARLVDMGVPAERVQEFDWWQAAAHAGVKLTATPSQHFSGRTLSDRNSTLWASWVLESGGQRIYYSGDTGYFGGFKQIGERFGGFDLALMENGAYDTYWPAVHMTPEQSVQAFIDLRAQVLFSVHNSTFDLAFHTWQDPLNRLADLAEAKGLALATPEIGEVMTVGQPRINRRWWAGLK